MSVSSSPQRLDGTTSVGGLILPRLKALGVDCVYANSGTDFPPIIEGIAQAQKQGIELPEVMIVSHEHAAMGMAYGNYKLTRQPQGVILHTNVGLSNAATGAINASRENVPIILISGRTPVTEHGRLGSRTVPIGWGQEMFDQAAMIREVCKWEYELRFPEQIVELIDRAHSIANSTPKGPVYLSLPREVLSMDALWSWGWTPPRFAPYSTAPAPRALATLAQWIAQAKFPIMIAQRGTEGTDSFATLNSLVQEFGIGVCSWWATGLAVASDNPCYLGSDPDPWLSRSDLVIVLNSMAPWWPDRHPVSSHAKIVHMGPDPLFAQTPIRNFRSDLSLAGEASDLVALLDQEMRKQKDGVDKTRIRKRVVKFRQVEKIQERRAACLLQGKTSGVVTKDTVSCVLGQLLKGSDTTVFSELGANLDLLGRTHRDSWFQEPYSGGLGWSFPAALGAKLAKKEKLIVAMMGDGSYLFSNPVVCHQVSEALGIPILVIIVNNEEWGAVRQSVLDMYPDGCAARLNKMPLTSLSPSPDFCKIAESCRSWARRVDTYAKLSITLEQGIEVVTREHRTAMVEIAIQG